jgi:hypothetical protein
MKALRVWFRREARRVARRIRLEDALLGGRFGSYAVYRLRFFGARTLVAAALHAIRIVLAFRLFLPGDFTAILAAEAAASLAGGFWWGSLETMRERVRDLHADGRPQAMAAEIARWLSWTMRFSAAFFAAGLLWAGIRAAGTGRSLSPADLFLVSIPVRFGLELVARCYHSGIYAVRRVYRPLTVILMVEGVSFGAALALWPIAGAWALPAAALVSTIVAAAFLFRFTARAYRHFGISPWPHINLREASRPRGAGGREWRRAGTAYALMRIDAVTLVAVAAAAHSGASPLAALLLAIGPLVRASSDWTQLFYFDLKRQDAVLLQRMKTAFEKKLVFLSFPVALTLWAAAAGTAVLLFGGRLGRLQPALILFLAARSALAAHQMRAFAARSYIRLIWTGAGVAGGWGLAAAFLKDPALVVIAGAAVLFAALPLTAFRRASEPDADRISGRILALPDWIRAARDAGGPVSIYALQFSPGSTHRGGDEPGRWAENDRWAHRRIAEAAARRPGRNGFVAMAGPARVLILEKKGRPPHLSREGLLAQGAGLIRAVRTTGLQPDGRAAVAAAAAAGLWGSENKNVSNGEVVTASGILGYFSDLFPRGVAYAPGEPVPRILAALSSDERGAIFSDALAFAADFHGRRPSSRFEATVYVEDGVIRLLFVLGPSTPASFRARWRETIRRLNFQAALSDQPAFSGSRRM